MSHAKWGWGTMAVSAAEVARLASLARVDLTPDELDEIAPQLDVILEAVASVGEVATLDVPPTSHAVPLVNVMRPDEPRVSYPPAVVLAGAPASEDDCFRAPHILDDSEAAA